ncbi:unnamed protein product, partial [Leptidea sinapis]
MWRPSLYPNSKRPQCANRNHFSELSHQSTPQSNVQDKQSSPNKLNTGPLNNVNTPSNNPVGVVKGVQQAKTPEPDSTMIKDVPPYRDPPPPYRSPPPLTQGLRKSPSHSRTQPNHMSPVNVPDDIERNPEAVSYNSQYRELVSLYDAEIGFWENKGREQERQIQSLNYVEEESEIVKQNEKTLKSEVVLLRSKLANCETELLQCKNKIRKLLEDIHNEQRMISSRQQENRQALERSMLAEMENLQTQIQQAKHATEINHLTAENLKREVGLLETAIMEKKRQAVHEGLSGHRGSWRTPLPPIKTRTGCGCSHRSCINQSETSGTATDLV